MVKILKSIFDVKKKVLKSEANASYNIILK